MKQELTDMQLTPHFNLSEFEKSATAEKYGIDNRVPAKLIKNVKALAEELEVVRTWWGFPIIISSGYRCKKVNEVNHGAKTSQHMKGEAADLIINNKKCGGWSLWKLFLIIYETLDFDQLIWETRPNGSKWIHVSFVTYRKNRHQCMQCKDGRTYQPLKL